MWLFQVTTKNLYKQLHWNWKNAWRNTKNEDKCDNKQVINNDKKITSWQVKGKHKFKNSDVWKIYITSFVTQEKLNQVAMAKEAYNEKTVLQQHVSAH